MPLPRKPTKEQEERASFNPDAHGGGGFALADGDYTIKSCITGMYTFGQYGDSAAFIVTYVDDEDAEHLVPYKAGDSRYILPSNDGEGFVIGPEVKQGPPVIYNKGAAHIWLKSWKDAGYEFVNDNASQFDGIRVRLTGALAPKGKTNEGYDNTLPVVAKILGAQSKAAPSRPTGRTTPAKSAASAVASSRTAPATSASNGELSDAALALVMQVLEKAADQTMPIPKLAMGVYMAAQKDADYKPNASAIKKLITSEWLGSQEGIEADDDNAALAS